MPSSPPSLCSTPGCAGRAPRGGPCEECRTDRRRDVDAARGPGRQVYATRGHRVRFRRAVLAREPLCRLCGRVATVADHWPTSRRDLEATGLDVNDPDHGRALCKPCHDRSTARHQPGGWNAHRPSQAQRSDP